ncbi:MAG: hypothetical protein V4629_07275 [Pseudomonadota bacterium]
MGSGYDFGTDFSGGSSNPYNSGLPTGDENTNPLGEAFKRLGQKDEKDIDGDGITNEDLFTYTDPTTGETVTVAGVETTVDGVDFIDVNGDGICNGGDVLLSKDADGNVVGCYAMPPGSSITVNGDFVDVDGNVVHFDGNFVDVDGDGLFTDGTDILIAEDINENQVISFYSCWTNAAGDIFSISGGTVTTTLKGDLTEGAPITVLGIEYAYSTEHGGIAPLSASLYEGQTRDLDGDGIYEIWDGSQWINLDAAAVKTIFGEDVQWGYLIVTEDGKILAYEDSSGTFVDTGSVVNPDGTITTNPNNDDNVIYQSGEENEDSAKTARRIVLLENTEGNVVVEYQLLVYSPGDFDNIVSEGYEWEKNWWDAYPNYGDDEYYGNGELKSLEAYNNRASATVDPNLVRYITEDGPKSLAEIEELAAQGIYYDKATGQQIDGDFPLDGTTITTMGGDPIIISRSGNILNQVDADGTIIKPIGWAITGPDNQSIFNIFAPGETYVPPPTVISENGVTYVLQDGIYVTPEQALINDPDGTFNTGLGTTITISQGETSAKLPMFTITEDVPASADGAVPAAQNVWVDIERAEGSHELIADEFFVDLTGDRYLGADGAWHTLSETVQGFAGAGGEIPLAGGLMLTVETDAAGYTAMYVVSPNGASENFAGAYSPGGGYSELGVFYGGEDSEGNPQWKVLDKNGNWVTLTQEVDAEGNLVGVPVESIDGNTYELNGNAVSGITAEGKGFEVREKFGYIIASGSEGAPDGIVGSVRPPDKPGSMNMYRLMAGFFVFMDKLSEALETIKNALEAIAAQERALGIVETRVTDDASQGHTTTSAEIAKEFETLTPQELQALEDKGWITVDSDGNITLTTEGEAAFGFEGGYAMTGDAVGEGVHLDLTTFNTSINNTKNDISGDRKILENELTQNTTLYTTVFSKNVSELISRFDMKDDLRL